MICDVLILLFLINMFSSLVESFFAQCIDMAPVQGAPGLGISLSKFIVYETFVSINDPNNFSFTKRYHLAVYLFVHDPICHKHQCDSPRTYRLYLMLNTIAKTARRLTVSN